MKKNSSAFSLIEITLALGIIGFALVAALGLVPVALTAGREAIEATVASQIAENAADQVRAALSTPAAFQNPPALGPYLYDVSGQAVAAGSKDALYRAQIAVADLPAYPSLSVDASTLRAVSVKLGWPVDASTGTVINPTVNGAKFVFGFYVNRP